MRKLLVILILTIAISPCFSAAVAEEEVKQESKIVIWDRPGDLYRVFDNVISQFQELYPNIEVEHVAVNIAEKLPTTLAAGVDVPDGTFIEDIVIPQMAEHFTDLTDKMEPYIDDIVPFKLRVNTYNDKIIGIPFDVDPGLLFYRKDLVEAAAVDINTIQTYDDLIDAAKQVQNTLGDNVKPIHLEASPFLGQMWIEMFVNQMGTSLIDENGKVQVDSEEYIQVLKWIDKVNKLGLGNRAEYFSPDDIAAIENDEVVFYPWAMWFVYGPENLFSKTKGLWSAISLPAWTEGGARGANMGGSSFVIPKKAKNPDLAWLYYEFLMLNEKGYSTVYGPNEIYPGGLNSSLPSYFPAQATQLFINPKGLGDLDFWKVAADSTKDIPGNYHYPTWYAQAVDFLGANLQRLLDGKLTPVEAAIQSADAIRSQLANR